MTGQRLCDRVQHQFQLGFGLFQPFIEQQWRVDHRQGGAAALLTGADRDLPPMSQALVGAFVLESYLAAFADDRGDFVHAQLGGFLDRPVHAFAPGQALAEMQMQRRVRLAGEGFGQLHAHVFLADFQQAAEEFVARTVEHLQRVTLGHAQYAADVVGLGFRQLVFAEAQGGVDKKAGQSHGVSLNIEMMCCRAGPIRRTAAKLASWTPAVLGLHPSPDHGSPGGSSSARPR